MLAAGRGSTPGTSLPTPSHYTLVGNDGAFATIMLMFVGDAHGSTAGGIKVTTLAVLVSLA